MPRAPVKEKVETPPQDPVPPPEPEVVAAAPEIPTLRWDQVVYGTAPSGTGRCNHTAAVVGSTAYFIGGYDGTGAHLRGDAAVAALQLRPSASWVPTHLPTPYGRGRDKGLMRSQLCSCVVDGVIYIIGGWDGSSRGHPLLAYDPLEDKLAEVPVSGESPSYLTFAAAASVGSRLVVYGGCGAKPENGTWTLDMSDKPRGGDGSVTWVASTSGDVPPARSSHAMTSIGQRVWMFGGKKEDGQALGDLHCYEVDLSSTSSVASVWSTASDVVSIAGDAPQPRFGHSMASVGSALYVFGGCGAGWKLFGDLRRLNVTPGSPQAVWEEVKVECGPGLCPKPRAYHAMAVVESALCVFGGRVDSCSPALNDLWTLETHLTSDNAGVDEFAADSDVQDVEGDALDAEE